MDWSTVVASFIGSAPAGVGAAVAIFKLLSDRSIERQKVHQGKELQEIQNTFSIGATSHMAAVAFDKHIDFCEKYVKEVYEVLNTLTQGSIAPQLLDPSKFSRVRQDWALWLTNEIDSWLEQYEGRITQLGGEAPDMDANGDRRGSNEASIKTAIAFLRGVLRTEELTALRNELVIRSSTRPQVG